MTDSFGGRNCTPKNLIIFKSFEVYHFICFYLFNLNKCSRYGEPLSISFDY